MKTEDQAVAAGHSMDPARWHGMFEVLLGRITGRLTRVEPWRRAREFTLRGESAGPVGLPP